MGRVLLDPSCGALSALSPGAILVDMTTSDPSLAAAASQKSCLSVDAPVSGGDRGAKNGTLAIFAGGDEGVIRRLSPLFALLGKVNLMGGPGSGQFAKLGNQVTIASTMVGLVEGMVFAQKAGLDVALFLRAIAGGAAGSKSLDLYGARILEAGFLVKHFVKDLGIGVRDGLARAQQLYLSLQAGPWGPTQALIHSGSREAQQSALALALALVMTQTSLQLIN